MVKLKLSIRMEADNVTDVAPTEDFDFTMKISCTDCRAEHSNPVSINVKDEAEISGSRGKASFVWRCTECKREHSASFVPPTSSSKNLINQYVPSGGAPTYQPLIELDCRGLEPKTFEFTSSRGGSWQAKAAASDEGEKTRQASFTFELDEDGRWDDYDEVNSREVGVRDIEYKWERA